MRAAEVFTERNPLDAAAMFLSAAYESSEATDVGTPDHAEKTKRLVTSWNWE